MSLSVQSGRGEDEKEPVWVNQIPKEYEYFASFVLNSQAAFALARFKIAPGAELRQTERSECDLPQDSAEMRTEKPASWAALGLSKMFSILGAAALAIELCIVYASSETRGRYASLCHLHTPDRASTKRPRASVRGMNYVECVCYKITFHQVYRRCTKLLSRYPGERNSALVNTRFISAHLPLEIGTLDGSSPENHEWMRLPKSDDDRRSCKGASG